MAQDFSVQVESDFLEVSNQNINIHLDHNSEGAVPSTFKPPVTVPFSVAPFSVPICQNDISEHFPVVASNDNMPVSGLEPVFAAPPATPVLDAPEGIKFDFNDGLRILIPNTGKEYYVRFSDFDTGNVLFFMKVKSGNLVTSVKKYYIRFRIEILHSMVEEQPFFIYEMDLLGKDVMIQLPVTTLGDAIGWFSYVERFQKKHHCNLICVMSSFMIDLLQKQYPEIRMITKSQASLYRPYATYCLGLFFQDENNDRQPVDFRFAGNHRSVGYILGLRGKELDDIPPRFDLSAPRTIKEKYVVIATQSTCQAKYWNCPNGWLEVIDFLKRNGYRVLCADRERCVGRDYIWNYIPYGVEDFTGDYSLQERINLIKDADFFIGLSSGLSWLAWGCHVPVVMISGFTHPKNEFETPYRIINYHTCNSCWNDMRVKFDHYDHLWCPRHKGDSHQFECSKNISPTQIINVIKTIPEFRPNSKS